MSQRVYRQRGDLGGCELLPRIRLIVSRGNVGIGFGWIIWWVHIWVWKAPPVPPPPPVPIGDRWYICDDSDCAWVGRLEETVHPKHETELVLCPECHENTAWFNPHEFIPCNPEFDPTRYAAGLCHECGLPDLHDIHTTPEPERGD